MNTPNEQRYFVRQLDGRSYRPSPDSEYEVQILNADGEGEICAYVSGKSNEVLYLVHASKGRLSVKDHGIPLPVIEAAKQRRAGDGQYINGDGQIVVPTFLPPAR